MRKFVASAAAVVMSAGMAMADPAVGLWRTEPGDTGGYLHVAVAKCGEALCGVIKQAIDKDGKPVGDYEHLGKRMLWDMKSNGDGSYSGGKIWAPGRNKTYKSKMSLSGDRLEVSGCVAIICRGQTWMRIK